MDNLGPGTLSAILPRPKQQCAPNLARLGPRMGGVNAGHVGFMDEVDEDKLWAVEQRAGDMQRLTDVWLVGCLVAHCSWIATNPMLLMCRALI